MKKAGISWKTEGIYVKGVKYSFTKGDLETIQEAKKFLTEHPKMTGINIIPEGNVDFYGDADFTYDVVLIKVSSCDVLLYAQSKWDSSYQVESDYIEV